jgi:hypothetical protein
VARYPAALWLPLDSAFVPGRRITEHNRVNLHVAVSEAPSLRGFFNQAARPSSHFYVRKSGVVEQYVDTAYRAEADLEGNDATISVETQGGLRNAQSEPWTDEQVDALAALFRWAAKTHGIPMKLATDSRVGESSHGLSWHRLGIDPWRVVGGMRYSKAAGKVCPGDAKIRQIPTILARAKGDDEMSADDALVGVHRLFAAAANPVEGEAGKIGRQTRDNLRAILAPMVEAKVAEALDAEALATAIAKQLPGVTRAQVADAVKAALAAREKAEAQRVLGITPGT